MVRKLTFFFPLVVGLLQTKLFVVATENTTISAHNGSDDHHVTVEKLASLPTALDNTSVANSTIETNFQNTVSDQPTNRKDTSLNIQADSSSLFESSNNSSSDTQFDVITQDFVAGDAELADADVEKNFTVSSTGNINQQDNFAADDIIDDQSNNVTGETENIPTTGEVDKMPQPTSAESESRKTPTSISETFESDNTTGIVDTRSVDVNSSSTSRIDEIGQSTSRIEVDADASQSSQLITKNENEMNAVNNTLLDNTVPTTNTKGSDLDEVSQVSRKMDGTILGEVDTENVPEAHVQPDPTAGTSESEINQDLATLKEDVNKRQEAVKSINDHEEVIEKKEITGDQLRNQSDVSVNKSVVDEALVDTIKSEEVTNNLNDTIIDNDIKKVVDETVLTKQDDSGSSYASSDYESNVEVKETYNVALMGSDSHNQTDKQVDPTAKSDDASITNGIDNDLSPSKTSSAIDTKVDGEVTSSTQDNTFNPITENTTTNAEQREEEEPAVKLHGSSNGTNANEEFIPSTSNSSENPLKLDPPNNNEEIKKDTDQVGQDEASNGPTKGTLADFFNKASNRAKKMKAANAPKDEVQKEEKKQDIQKEETRSTEAKNSNDNLPPEKLAEDSNVQVKAVQEESKPAEKLLEPTQDDYSKPYCTVWGNFQPEKRLADLTILKMVFENWTMPKEKNIQHKLSPAEIADAIFPDPILKEEVVKSFAGRNISNTNWTKDDILRSNTPNSDFLHGLDDINKLFEGVDPPDELDVGASGSSIQEVLIRSTIRIIRKRIQMVFSFVHKNVKKLQSKISNRLNNSEPPKSSNRELDEDRKSSILEKLQDIDIISKLPDKEDISEAIGSSIETVKDFFESTKESIQQFLDQFFTGGNDNHDEEVISTKDLEMENIIQERLRKATFKR